MLRLALFISVLFGSLLQAAVPTFRLFPVGEKTYQTHSLSTPLISVDMAQLETQFVVMEINEKFDLKKHLPIYTASTDSPAPFDIHLSWLLGHKIGKGPIVEDIVLPMDTENVNRFPKDNFPTKKLLLIEIKTRLLDHAQNWKGKINITDLSSKKTFSIPATISVHKFVLPGEFKMRTSFGFAPWNVIRKHNIVSAKENELYAKYFALAREHRIDLHKIYVEFSKNEDNLLAHASNHHHSFENMWKLARGSDEKYARMRTTDLPVPENFKTADFKNEKFWRKLNSEAGGKDDFFVYFDDEPNKERVKKIQESLTLIKKWAPQLKFLVTTYWQKELDGLVDIWCPNLINWQTSGSPQPERYAGKDFWTYVSCNSHGCSTNETTSLPDLIINRPSAVTYSLPFVAERIGASGVLYYDTTRAYMESEQAPWKDPKIFNGAGEGNLFYPCPKSICSSQAPKVFPSLRLKILQNAFEALEIIRTAKALDPKLSKDLEKIVRSPRSWNRDIQSYQIVKKRALEILDAK